MHNLRETFFSDHDFAAYLRREGAINNYTSEGNSVRWTRDDGSLAAVAIYDNANCTRRIYVPMEKGR